MGQYIEFEMAREMCDQGLIGAIGGEVLSIDLVKNLIQSP